MKSRRFLTAGSILLLSSLMIRCGQEKTPPDPEKPYDIHAEEGHIYLSADEIDEFGITIGTAGPGKLRVHIDAPGEVVIPPDNLAHIHPRFPGMVKEVRKHIGDRVKAGEVLAVIESNESLTDYELKSLIDGTIVEKHITRGEIVEADMSPHGFVVADLREVWVYLNLYQKDLPFVRKGQTVTISSGPGLEQTTGKISYVSPILDEVTRTAKARVVLPNPEGIWKPGLFVSGEIAVQEFSADIVVPRTAIESLDNKPCVFIRSGKGFQPRFIVTGREDHSHVEVVAGLNKGENYVMKGGFTLKAELQKELFGDDPHGH
jgi:cobalt-zinc-cadmium efflux system membrane fusion protein